MHSDELIIKLPENNRLFQEIRLFKKTEKFIQQNQRLGINSVKLAILDQKGIRNRERMEIIQNKLPYKQSFFRGDSREKFIMDSAYRHHKYAKDAGKSSQIRFIGL